MINTSQIKSDFPIFKRQIQGKPIIYLDNASTTQKPKQVIEKLINCYENSYANIHRGIYTLSEESTKAYENSRNLTAEFINANPEEIIFTKSTTESINLVAYTWGEKNIKKDDEIIISILEHHSNFVPWQQLCERKKAHLKIIPIKKDLTLDISAYKKLLTKKTKLVALSAISNVFGTIIPIKQFIALAHKKNAKVLVDGAQSIAHIPTDVKKLDCDFFAFSGHKMLGPTGVGVLYGKKEILKNMPPFLFGGDMIKSVTIKKTTFNDLPYKFEGGTPNIADIIAYSEAIKYLQKIGLKEIHDHELNLLKYAIKKFGNHKEVRLLTPPINQASGILSFTVKEIHPHDIAEIFNRENVCIRAGHHCAQPLMENSKLSATARMSFYIYNDFSDIDKAEKTLIKAINIFK